MHTVCLARSLSALFVAFFILMGVFVLTGISCSLNAPSIQPQVNGLVVANRLEKALKVLNSQPHAYGPNNELLFLLDKGLILHLAKHYPESIETLAQAQRKIDALYTKSLTRIAGSWIYNDYTAPYQGEDFEHVLVNVFQALNYVGLGQIGEALVEARDVDSKLNVINSLYPPQQKNVYREDAFVRFLMGILYEASGTAEDINNALISYQKAAQIYAGDYEPTYRTAVPRFLQENLLSTAQWMGEADFAPYRKQFPQAGFIPLKEKAQKAEVYLIQYNGLAPIKVQTSFPFPLPGGYMNKVAFPHYSERSYDTKSSRFIAVDRQRRESQEESELAEPLGAIAVKNLENRRIRVFVKAALRPTGKYLAERGLERKAQESWGDPSIPWYRSAASLYNLFSEQADLRSWQTLPDEIRLARLILNPGEYKLRVDNLNSNRETIEQVDLGTVILKAGEKKFFFIRTAL